MGRRVRRGPASRRDRLRRWSAGLAAVGSLALLPLLGGWAWRATPEPAPDPVDTLVRDLAADGEAGDVIQCVLRLAEDDLRVGPLDPDVERELVVGCRAARHGLDLAQAARERADDDTPDDDEGPPMALGDDARLDELWLDCEAGSGLACDRLFDEAPVGSAYETFGLTCGDRPDLLECLELDRPEDEPADGLGP